MVSAEVEGLVCDGPGRTNARDSGACCDRLVVTPKHVGIQVSPASPQDCLFGSPVCPQFSRRPNTRSFLQCVGSGPLTLGSLLSVTFARRG